MRKPNCRYDRLLSNGQDALEHGLVTGLSAGGSLLPRSVPVQGLCTEIPQEGSWHQKNRAAVMVAGEEGRFRLY